MYCKNCGEQLNDNALFCRNCGNEIGKTKNEDNNSTDTKTVLYTIKPSYHLLYKLICAIGMGILLILCLFMATKYRYISEAEVQKLLEEGTLLNIGLVLVIIFIVIILLVDYLKYKKIKYLFYSNRLEYQNTFYGKVEKEIKYNNIREVVKSQNILERIFGLGKIKLYTNAANNPDYRGRGNDQSANGISIHCVRNIDEQYANIKKIIDSYIQDRD